MPIVFVAGSREEIRSGRGKVVVSLTQAAAALGVNEATFRRLVAQNAITPYPERIRGMPLYLEDEVEKLRLQREKQGY